jgi:hypothetical protein
MGRTVTRILEKTTKKQLRELVDRTRTIDQAKLNKLSKVKLIPMLNHLSLSKIKTLLWAG